MPRLADRRVKIELLRAAESAFSEHGLAAAKVEDITARAGVSKGAFYLHFDSKEDCFRQIIESFVARLAACLEPAWLAQKAPPSSIDEIRAIWHAHDREILEFCWQNRALVKMVFAGGGGTSYAFLIDEFAERAGRLAETWVRYGIQAGLYRRDIDPAITAIMMAGAYDRLAREVIRQNKRPDIDAWCRQGLDLFTRGMLPEGTGLKGETEPPIAEAPAQSGPRKVGVADQKVTTRRRRETLASERGKRAKAG